MFNYICFRLNKMEGYSIQYLEQLTGIKAHTIRVWEQRYNLLQPLRTPSNVRLYHDEDLKKVLRISTLLNAGYKIGDLAFLSEEQINNRINELTYANLESDKLDFAHINSLITATMEYNEVAFDKTYHEIVKLYGLKHVYMNIIHPFLVRIGALWNVGDIMPAQEHFISNLIRQKLYAAIDNTPLNLNGEHWVLYLPENEEHETGLLFANFLLRLSGKKTIYLGQRVPQENVATVVNTVKAKGIVCFQVAKSTPQSNNQLRQFIVGLNVPSQKIICCPYDMAELTPHADIKLIHTPIEFINWLSKENG